MEWISILITFLNWGLINETLPRILIKVSKHIIRNIHTFNNFKVIRTTIYCKFYFKIKINYEEFYFITESFSPIKLKKICIQVNQIKKDLNDEFIE